MTLYRGIIADPPWQYGSPRAMPTVIKKNGEVAIAVDTNDHYPTMPLEEIKALDVPADRDCFLFMWTTNPFLADGSATEVVRAWGFEPVTVVTWAKGHKGDPARPSMKNGYWFRSASEHILVAKRGKIKRPAGFPALPTWFPHERTPHSVKPTTMHDIMEQAVPEGPWLEMFARRAHPGWSLWGNQAPGTSNALERAAAAADRLADLFGNRFP